MEEDFAQKIKLFEKGAEKMSEVEMFKNELVNETHCSDHYGESCDGDCEGCIRYAQDNLTEFENLVRTDERAKIIEMIEEISFGTLYCMADMCDRADKNCEKCALDYVIERLKEKK